MDVDTKADLIRKWREELIRQFEGAGQKDEAEGKAQAHIDRSMAEGTVDTQLAEFAQLEADRRRAEIATKLREAEDLPEKVAIIQAEVDEYEAIKTELEAAEKK